MCQMVVLLKNILETLELLSLLWQYYSIVHASHINT